MRKTISTETTTVTSPAWTFAPDSVTVNGYTSTARYSLAKDATLYVFAGMLTPGTDKLTPVRFALKPAQGEIYTAALSAAGLTPAPEEPAATVEDVGPAEPAAPAEDVRPAEPAAPVENVGPKRAPRKKAAPPSRLALRGRRGLPAPVEDVGPAEPVKPAPVEKPWIGTSISGDGWTIDFDAKLNAPAFASPPRRPPQKAIVDAAGFYYRNDLKCFVKKLTCKAYRAAQSVAAGLKAIA
ncbi:MAG: hypothetical protein ACLVJB_05230 [Christensenellales bacterium]